MKNRNFYTLLLASMLLTFSAQAQDFDISLPKATVLHQNASGSFNNSWYADGTGYLSSMDQWNNNSGLLWFISPAISFSRGFRVGLRFGFGNPGTTSLFGTAGYDFYYNQPYMGIGANAGPLSLTYGTGGWNASLGFGWQHGFGIEVAGLNYNRRESLSFNSPFGSSYLCCGGATPRNRDPYRRINRAIRKSGGRYFSSKKKYYDYLWENSFDENGNPIREVSGWELENGDAIALPFDKNYIKEDGTFVSYNDAIQVGRIKGRLAVSFEGNKYYINTHTHTHPQSYGLNPSQADAVLINRINRPIHILHRANLYRVGLRSNGKFWSTNLGSWK